MNGEDTCRADAKSDESGSRESQQSPANELLQSLRELVLEQRKLNALLAQLVGQNADLIDQMVQQEPEEDDDMPSVYLDGRPRN